MEDKSVKKIETVSIVGFVFSFIIPIVGLILTIIGISKAKKNNSDNGLAIAGLIISIIHIIIRLLLIGFISLLLGVSVKGLGNIKEGYNKMCSHAQKCEYVWGDLYNCSYKSNNINYTITCNKDMISEDLIESYDKEIVEAAAGKYYIHIYDGLVETIDSELFLNDIIITINNGEMITVDKDTLIGYDFEHRYVNLNDYLND